jgi:acyl transferase domain-containing protein
MDDSRERDFSSDVAVIGMAGRFPGAHDVGEYWLNLAKGVESITTLSDEELLAAGVDRAMLANPSYVRAAGILEDVEFFDAEFFGMNAREAEVTDPQHRLFLECAWEALEHAGYGARFDGPIGVFGGCSINSYYLRNVSTNPDAANQAGAYQVFIGNDKDFIATRVSYKLDLRGPGFTVQTACSTSLVAAHLACQSLLTHQSDVALAGGVSVFFPQKTGYLYQEGMILSPDGHCRAFDAKGQGTLGGQGVGIVVLKRMVDAIRDGDTIHAVIKGSAINNDGSDKVGFTAPSVNGQAEVIATAQAMAGVEPDSIGYIEAHGTATPLGDPIEVAALMQVFRASTQRTQFCALGSVKTNIGHLDAAAGVAGLIKTVLALKRAVIPASLHFEQPNPEIDFASSPFYVNARTTDWNVDPGIPRRAGVSSFGIGGTNAHVVLEEPPAARSSTQDRPYSILVCSAKTEHALAAATDRLAEHLRRVPDADIRDAAYTLQVGRKAFEYRRSFVVADRDSAITALTQMSAKPAIVDKSRGEPTVAFMFSGQGSQYAGMAAELYRYEATFREDVDRCNSVLRPLLDVDLVGLLIASGPDFAAIDRVLADTRYAQPALFVIEYALARLWMSWGIRPHAMIGHSIGEFAAATLAGVMTVEDALASVALRGRLMQQLPSGAMSAVLLSEADVRLRLANSSIEIAAVNAPAFCTVAGESASIEEFERGLAADGVEYRRLHTSHAFHSAMMDGAVEPFRQHMASIRLLEPKIPYISSVSGTWITAADATDPSYWARQLRGAVRFGDGVRELLKETRIFLEIGPGNALCTFARQTTGTRAHESFAALPHASERGCELRFALTTLGRLWQNGAPVDWAALHAEDRLQRIPLPSYPFERKRYFIEPKAFLPSRATDAAKRTDVAEWLYIPSWKRADLVTVARSTPRRWLLIDDEHGISDAVALRLRADGDEVVQVRAGADLALDAGVRGVVNPFRPADYATLLSALAQKGGIPETIVSFLGCTALSSDWDSWRDPALDGGYPCFTSVLALVRALADHPALSTAAVVLVSNQVHSVLGDETITPLKALAAGLSKVVPQEFPQLRCRTIDIGVQQAADRRVDALLEELRADSDDSTVAHRGAARWLQTFEPVPSSVSGRSAAWLKPKGTYLVTGGLGSVGLLFAEHLAEHAQARLILTGRSEFPPRDRWSAWLESHDDADATSERIRRLVAMESHGASLLVASADSSDLGAMQRLVSNARERFGRIDGVIHAAGLIDAAFLPDIDQAHYERQFASKVRGVQVLERLFDEESLDFCLLTSSISTVLGGLGFGAYAAANAFMDAVAEARARSGSSVWRSIDWDGWGFATQPSEQGNLGASLRELLMTPAESRQALDAIQSLRAARIVVSTANLEARRAQWTTRGTVQAAEPEAAAHERPRIVTAYIEPGNDTQRRLTAIWGQLLGIERIGINDDFFELGGHSLLGTRVLARVQETFGVKLPLRALFEAPTAAQLAEQIDTLVWVRSAGSDGAIVDEMEELQF